MAQRQKTRTAKNDDPDNGLITIQCRISEVDLLEEISSHLDNLFPEETALCERAPCLEVENRQAVSSKAISDADVHPTAPSQAGGASIPKAGRTAAPSFGAQNRKPRNPKPTARGTARKKPGRKMGRFGPAALVALVVLVSVIAAGASGLVSPRETLSVWVGLLMDTRPSLAAPVTGGLETASGKAVARGRISDTGMDTDPVARTAHGAGNPSPERSISPDAEADPGSGPMTGPSAVTASTLPPVNTEKDAKGPSRAPQVLSSMPMAAGGIPGQSTDRPVGEPDGGPDSGGLAVAEPVPPQMEADPTPFKRTDPEPALARTPLSIVSFLHGWKTAWEHSAGGNGDMEPYMAFYAEDFMANGLDKQGWETDKSWKNSRKDWIRVELSDIRVSGPAENGRVLVTFRQDFQSSNFSDRSENTLVLKPEPDGWKIVAIHHEEP